MQSFTLKSPADVVAVAPVVLGFMPEESIVMLTFGSGTPFHVRVDLPPDEGELQAIVDALLVPCLSHGVNQIVFTAFTADAALADAYHVRARRTFEDAGITVLDTLHAHAGIVTSAPSGASMAYDVTTSAVTATAAVEHGKAPFASRAEMVASLDPAPNQLGAAVVQERVDLLHDYPADIDKRWIAETVTDGLDGGVLNDTELACLLADLIDPTLRDIALLLHSRENAQAAVNFWSDAVRRAPAEFVAPVAALLGVAAWLKGDGAMAWVAVDRARAAQPANALADVVESVLTNAVSPDNWADFLASFNEIGA